MKKIIMCFYFVEIIVLNSCKIYKCSEEVKGVSFIFWKQDSIGCKGYRALVIDTIISQRELLIGLKTKCIYKYFGEPNLPITPNGRKVISYFYETDVRCSMKKGERFEDNYETIYLRLLYNKRNKIIDVGLVGM